MTQRSNPFQQSPELYRKLIEWSDLLKDSAIERTTRELVMIRVSQQNGCAFCVDMHVKEARLHGERELRVHHLAIWRESTLFSERERAALAWAELLTRLPAHGVCDEAYEAARARFSEKELSDLSFAVMVINSWNRLGVGFRGVPGSADKLYGLDKAGLN